MSELNGLFNHVNVNAEWFSINVIKKQTTVKSSNGLNIGVNASCTEDLGLIARRLT